MSLLRQCGDFADLIQKMSNETAALGDTIDSYAEELIVSYRRYAFCD
jgi:hypothetical protein